MERACIDSITKSEATFIEGCAQRDGASLANFQQKIMRFPKEEWLRA